VNFTFDGLEAAKKTLDRLANFVGRLLEADGEGGGDDLKQLIERVQKGFEGAMDDDLNISVALAHLFDFVRDVNNLLDSKRLSKEEAKKIYDLMSRFDKALGVIGEPKKEGELTEEAEELIRKREEARETKDWKTADEIRERLKAMGIVIEDTAQGAKWRKERQ
jgi:cysteinyl-tRNA synthetase